MEKIRVTNGVYWVAVPEESLWVLCGCPADAIKHLYKGGLISRVEKDGTAWETGPNAVLLSDLSMQHGAFCNLAEFPVLQMLYRQGMIIPNHPGNTGRKPMLIGLPEQVKSQSEYIFRGNYGLRSVAELEEAGADEQTAREVFRMKRRFAFDHIRETAELLDLRPLQGDTLRLTEHVFLHRQGINRYEFICKGERVEVDLNLADGEDYLPPYELDAKPVKRGYFDIIHSGEGDGWDRRRPCMASIIVFQGRIYLIDAGPNILYSLAALGIGTGDIAGIFQTHAHDDHCAGLTALIRSDHRIAYYATPIVRASVAKKICALMNINEDMFARYFDLRDLDMDAWNDVDGLEVKPVLSPHPVETTAFFFRARGEEGYRTYAHLADIASFAVLDGMVEEDETKSGISPARLKRTKAIYAQKADIKKVDIGGGLIHGNAADFANDKSPRLLLSHTDRQLTDAEREIGSSAVFGDRDILIPNRRDTTEKIIDEVLRLSFPRVPQSSIDLLANCPVEEFAPGSILIRNGAEAYPVYLVLAGIVEYINAAERSRSLIFRGFLAGETCCIAGRPADGTYRAVGTALALRIPEALYIDFIWSNGLETELLRLQDYRSFLRSSVLCGELTSCILQTRIARAMTAITLKGGEPVPQEDKPSLAIVETGTIAIKFDGRVLERTGKGGFIGEEQLMPPSAVRYTAVAETDASLFRIPASVVEDIPFILWKLQEVYERRMGLIGTESVFRWHPEYSVGVADFDREHRTLFERIDAVATAFRSDDRAARETCLRALHQAADAHVTHEEEVMHEAGYPELAHQRREHAGFIERLEGYLAQVEEESGPDPDECLGYLKDWLIRHTLGEDRRYVGFFAEKGIH